MPLFRTGVIVAVITFLLIGGIVEIKFHPDKVSQAPGRVLSLAQDQEARLGLIAWAISLKRTGEQWLIKDQDQKLELALAYIEIDAQQLKTELEKFDNPADTAPRVELLSTSLKRAQALVEDSPPETLVSIRKSTKAAYLAADDALQQISQDEATKNNLAQIIKNLEDHVGQVAGDQDAQLADEETATSSD